MKAARQQAIVDLLLNHTSLTTEALSEQLKVSKETIRRDLNELQTQGKILRNHGRAKEGANKQVISSQADSLIKISRIWAD
ncbi:DeoR family transcriptional regulator, partial [Escherichia coli]|uniref:DeoR family transcriptional regulator n=1 Tax=Escherichia coli TaxID=562 RepID=UPI00201F5CA1